MNLLKYLWYKAVIEGRFPFVILQFVFIPLALVYWLGISVRSLLYRLGIKKSVKLPCRVISVGNITVGGTGKTPLVMYLAKALAESGKKVGILARGYGRLPGGDDEALDNIPGVVRVAQADRVSAGKKLCAEGIEVIILDDGFQHWRIQRQVRPEGGLTVPTEGDIDIVVIDSASPFGNGWLLPAGILREPRRALKRADMFVLTHCNPASAGPSRLEEYLKQYNKPIVKTIHQPVGLFTLADNEIIPPEEWKSLRVYGFCGIGTPGHFRQTLKGLFHLVGFDAFPDHYLYTLSDIEQVCKRAGSVGADIVVTTEKDALRLGHIINKDSSYSPPLCKGRAGGVDALPPLTPPYKGGGLIDRCELAKPENDSTQPHIYFLRIELKVIEGAEALHKV